MNATGTRRAAKRSWAKRATYDLSRVAARMLAVATCRLRCEGRHYVPTKGGALICSNHVSHLDPILVGLACDRRLNYLARKSLFRFPGFRWLIEWYDAIPIERDGVGLGGLKETLKRLKRDEIVVIFPEGTRTPDGCIGPLRPGFCALARRGRVPLVPVAIVGAYRVWPRHRTIPRPSPIAIRFGPPILPEEYQQLSDDELVDRLRQAIIDCYQQAKYSQRVGECDRPGHGLPRAACGGASPFESS